MKLALSILFASSASVCAFQLPVVSVSKARARIRSTSSTTSLQVGLLIRETGKSQLDPAVIAKYDALPFPKDMVLAEYVWVDADGNTRSKTRTLPAKKVREHEST
jgi:hypothetical protein